MCQFDSWETYILERTFIFENTQLLFVCGEALFKLRLPGSPRMRRASWVSLVMIVTRYKDSTWLRKPGRSTTTGIPFCWFYRKNSRILHFHDFCWFSETNWVVPEFYYKNVPESLHIEYMDCSGEGFCPQLGVWNCVCFFWYFRRVASLFSNFRLGPVCIMLTGLVPLNFFDSLACYVSSCIGIVLRLAPLVSSLAVYHSIFHLTYVYAVINACLIILPGTLACQLFSILLSFSLINMLLHVLLLGVLPFPLLFSCRSHSLDGQCFLLCFHNQTITGIYTFSSAPCCNLYLPSCSVITHVRLRPLRVSIRYV